MKVHSSDDFATESFNRRFFQQFEQVVREVNTTSIRKVAGNISQDTILKVAAVVSLSRAQYLKEVLRLADIGRDGDIDPDVADELKQKRRAYEELLHGFGALRHALERGYVVLSS